MYKPKLSQGLPKYCDLSVKSTIIIIDMQENDKSQYFVITKFKIALSFNHQVHLHI